MQENFIKINFKNISTLLVLFLLGLCAISFTVLYIERSNVIFIKDNKLLIELTVVVIVSLLTVISYLFCQTDDSFVIKITLAFFVFTSIFTFGLYLVKVCGLEDKIDSVDSLRNYVLSYGQFVVPVFLLLQFLQVIILPIPSVVLLGVGIALFGAFFGALLSFISIVLASIFAFFIGKNFGVKTVGWLIGKNNLNKALKLVKGKDKIVLFFMFIFPFFPDDLLCFIAGLTTISFKYFFIVIMLTRFISIAFATLLLSGYLLPFYTWWGCLIWLIFFVITVIIYIYIYKNGEKLERGILRVFKKKNGKDYSTR